MYEGNIFLSQKQCAVLDTTNDSSKFLAHLISCFFSQDTLRKSSVTGEKRKKDVEAKPGLDPIRRNLLYSKTTLSSSVSEFFLKYFLTLGLMKEKTNNDAAYSSTRINKILAKRISNAIRPRTQPVGQSLYKQTQNNEQDSNSLHNESVDAFIQEDLNNISTDEVDSE